MDQENVEGNLDSSTSGNQGLLTANRGKFLIAAIVLISSLTYFAFMAFQSATVYYYTVGEINREASTQEGRIVRVSGKLVPDSFHRSEGSTVAYFSLTDGEYVMDAKHNGVLPDLFFNEHSEIILEGVHHTEKEFDSQNVIVKCPSKYVALSDSE